MDQNETTIINTAPKKSNTALIGSIIVIVLLIIVGIYAMKGTKNSDENQYLNDEAQNTNEPAFEKTTGVDQSTQSNSDEVPSIEEDLNNTDIDSLEEDPK